MGHSDAHGATKRGGGGGTYRSRSVVSSNGCNQGGIVARDPDFLRDFPALCEFMTMAMNEGKAVLTSTVLVFCEGGRFKGCFSDREADRSFFRSSESFAGLWRALESALAAGDADWRVRTHGRR